MKKIVLTQKNPDFYDMSELIAQDCEYNLMLSERSSGKSYQIKKKFIEDFINNNIKFIYLRRFVIDLKEHIVNSYFADENLPYRLLTKGKYDGIMCYRGNLYFFTYEDDKQVRGVQCGKYFALSAATHYKSMSLTEYKNIVFEEFVVESGGYDYLPNECDTLQQLVSTIARKGRVHVYMVGNKINSLCPYFRYWSLRNIPKQKEGTIDIYNMEYSDGVVRVAVEICKATNSKGRMFFGKVESNINNGVWTSQEFPKMIYKYQDCKLIYTTIWEWGDNCYKAEILNKEKHTFVFVRPFDINKCFVINEYRYISDKFRHELATVLWHTPDFILLGKADELFRDLWIRGHVCYSDNLTGEEFNNIYEIYTSRKFK